MNVHWVQVDVLRYAPTPLEAMCAVATLDTLSLLMAEHVWVRRYAVSAWHLILKSKHYRAIYYIHNFLQHNYIIDINECSLGTSGCNQYCTNTIGSYVCSCYLGYSISFDGRTCVGKKMCSQCMAL